jgi:DNA integrity scanning protein DisA with diadenylate cyclase activity
MNKSIDELETENRMIRLQLQELFEKERFLQEWLANNEYDIQDQLNEMEKYEGGSCDLCLGDCNTPGATGDVSN